MILNYNNIPYRMVKGQVEDEEAMQEVKDEAVDRVQISMNSQLDLTCG